MGWASRWTWRTRRCSWRAKRAATTPARFCIPTAASRGSDAQTPAFNRGGGRHLAGSHQADCASVGAGSDGDGGADDSAEDSADPAADGARLWTGAVDGRLLRVEHRSGDGAAVLQLEPRRWTGLDAAADLPIPHVHESRQLCCDGDGDDGRWPFGDIVRGRDRDAADAVRRLVRQ